MQSQTDFSSSSRTALSVNVNKVAWVRNTRPLDIPNVCRAAQLCLEAGAHGITVHPRPDQRHIRHQDVFDLARLMLHWPQREFNIEGNPLHNLMDLLSELHVAGLGPDQVTFVPDAVDQSTSDHGWQFPQDGEVLAQLIARCHAMNMRVSLFMDPDPHAMVAAKAAGADRVELYTETWASAHGTQNEQAVLTRFVEAAHSAQAVGLGVNAGHDLNLQNLTPFLRAAAPILEVSIGHALIGDALEMGYAQTVHAYLSAIDESFQNLKVKPS